jgi:hypothetical protein
VLRKRGIHTSDQPEHVMFGWTFDFTVANAAHSFTVGFYGGDSPDCGRWEGFLERAPILFGEPKSRRYTGVSPRAVRVIQSVLAESPAIVDVRWEQES